MKLLSRFYNLKEFFERGTIKNTGNAFNSYINLNMNFKLSFKKLNHVDQDIKMSNWAFYAQVSS